MVENKTYCPVDGNFPCPYGRRYNHWCYGDGSICEEGKRVEEEQEKILTAFIEDKKKERKKYIEQLNDAKIYFETDTNILNKNALNIVLKLIDKELSNQKDYV